MSNNKSIEYNVTISPEFVAKTTEQIISNSVSSCMLASLYSFFGSQEITNPTEEMTMILPILTGNSKISIRLIDWFVTNYSKKNSVIYPIYNEKKSIIRYFNVYSDYKSQLDGYRKRMFDPFCRKSRIPFYYTADKCLITTVGQLNFFKWILSNGILTYINEHYDIINKDMINSSKNKNKSTDNISISNDNSSVDKSSEKKRHELSENAMKTIKCIKQRIVVVMN